MRPGAFLQKSPDAEVRVRMIDFFEHRFAGHVGHDQFDLIAVHGAKLAMNPIPTLRFAGRLGGKLPAGQRSDRPLVGA